MMNKLDQLQAVHNAFFENDDSNFATMMKGFTISAICIAAVFFLYPY